MKRCFKCRQQKPLDAFYRHPMMRDGHLGKCKDCTKKDVRDGRAARLEQHLNYDRLRYITNPDRVAYVRKYCKMHTDETRARRAVWSAKNRDKKRAHSAVQKAILNGSLRRLPCEVCGRAAQAHHEDYSKQLDVRWLCALHHSDAHRRERGQKENLMSTPPGTIATPFLD